MIRTYSLRLSRVVVYCFFLMTIMTVSGCANVFFGLFDVIYPPQEDIDTGGAELLEVRGESFTLAWDSGAEPVSSYRVYTRPHGGTDWTPLASGLADASVTVTVAMLAYGVYEFAVSAVAGDGTESDLHTSLDPTADPESGWYLSWQAA